MMADDEQTVDARQSGHSQWVDHLNYGVTGHSALGLPENMLQQYIDASTCWHNVLQLVPGEATTSSLYVSCANCEIHRRLFF